MELPTTGTSSLPSHKEVNLLRVALLEWFCEHEREFQWRSEEASRYEKVIAELLLQRTTARAVSEVLPSFTERFPGWDDLAEASLDEIQDQIRPLGLWRRRSRRLKALASEMKARSGEFPAAREELESLPGVGQYIANAILMICHGDCQPLLDSNMVRVLERYFEPREKADIRHDEYLQSLSRELVDDDYSSCQQVNWAVLDFGALVCRPRSPRCGECPVREKCRFWNDRSAASDG